LPSESAIAFIAATRATSIASVVTLAKIGTPSRGPGFGPECQPTSLMPSFAAASMAAFCSTASLPPMTIASGLSATACVTVAWRHSIPAHRWEKLDLIGWHLDQLAVQIDPQTVWRDLDDRRFGVTQDLLQTHPSADAQTFTVGSGRRMS
jgi:hypothetical protein